MEFYQAPWKLVWNKLVRYPGGREIDRFRSIEPALDNGRPEAWIGSDTRVFNTPPDNPNEGCAKCILPDGEEVYLFEAIERNPEGVLGRAHIARSGHKLGVLVKLLDAQLQLGLQTHPTREYAKKWFHSDYGKAESWYVIGMREDASEPPYVLMGFKDGVTREMYEQYYRADDLAGMENCCHKVLVNIGDVFNIEAGVPHAVGEGCFVVEVQEPSDITVGAHMLKSGSDSAKMWRSFQLANGIELPPEGSKEESDFYDEQLLGCYIYNGCSYEENLKRYRIPHTVLRQGDWGEELVMIGSKNTPYFSFTQIEASAEAELRDTGDIQIGIVLEGEGKLCWDGGEMAIGKAEELFIPASAKHIRLVPKDGKVKMVLCHPPGVIS